MKYGFLDEAGDVGYTAGATDTFIVAVVVVGNSERLRKAVTKTRKLLGKSLRDLPELKAAGNDPRLVQKLLLHAVRIGFEAVAVVIDKKQFPRLLDPEDLYRYACTRAVRQVVEQFGPLSLMVDRRYKTKRLRDQLDQALKDGIGDLGIPLSVQHEDSQRDRALQVADAVAWSVFQKHERKDETAWRIIQRQVVEMKL